MRRRTWLLALVAAVISGCSPSPTERDIESELERQLRSVAGAWTGMSPALTLSFQLAEGANGALTGTGTMREAAAGSPLVPITVSGSYQRPKLVLAFTGMRRNGQSVRGDLSGQYTSVGGVSSTLVLSGVDGRTYSEQISMLLQEAILSSVGAAEGRSEF